MVDFDGGIIKYIDNFSKKTTGALVLDIGCGSGFYTNFFSDKNYVIGLDVQNAVKSEYHGTFDIVIANANGLPFTSNLFDLIISFDVIEHIKEDKKSVSESFRVLKKGGRIFWGTPNRLRLSNLLAFKILGRNKRFPLDLGTDEDGRIIHQREYSSLELYSLLKEAGFKDIKIRFFWFGLAPLKYGFLNVPEFLTKYCHYLFIEAIK